jgi:DNA-binding GntR family transcriptional regulator
VLTNDSEDTTISLAERAYRVLRELIITCEIEPGAWVSESQLAVQLGVGKTPTREALRRLCGEGLVTPTHRRGYQVTPITVAQVREVFEAYRIFVPEVAALVTARSTSEEIHELAEVAERWAGAREGDAHPGPTPFPLFIKLSRNPTIVDMGNRVIGHFERMVNFAIFHGALVDPEYLATLRAALASIEAGDEDAARAGVLALVDATRDTVIAALLSTPSLMTTPVAMTPQAR